jgi:hypothetical protein
LAIPCAAFAEAPGKTGLILLDFHTIPPTVQSRS